MTTQRNQTDLSAFIADNFGANATYVESLLQRFRSDPALVDEAWRAYFTELLGAEAAPAAQANGGASGAQATTEPRTTEPATTQTTTTTLVTQQQTAPAPTAGRQSWP